MADPFSQLPKTRYPARKSSSKATWIAVIVALHVIPVTILILFLTGVFHFSKAPPAEPDSRPPIIVKHVPAPTVPTKPATVTAPPIPPPPPLIAANQWDLPPVLPPAGLAALIISGANPPLPTGGLSLPPQVAPVIHEFESKHVGPIYALAIVPNGKFLLSAGADQRIRAWDTATTKLVKVFDGTPNVVRGLAVNGLGSAAASGGDDGAIRIWDLSLGREAFALKGHAGPVRGVAFSPNGQYILSGGADGTVRLWDVQTRETVRELKLGQPATCVAFCPDGRRALAGGDGGTIAVYDLEAATRLHKFTGHIAAAVTAVAFSRDGREAVSVGDDKKILLWDVATGGRLPIGGSRGATAILYAAPPQAVSYAGDGSWVVAAVADSSAAVMQPHGQGRTRISMPPLGKPLALAVAPDGSAAYFGTDQGAIRRMDFQGGTGAIGTNSSVIKSAMPEPATVSPPVMPTSSALAPKWYAETDPGFIQCVAVAANGRVVAGGTDRIVHVWDSNGKEVQSFPNMTAADNGVGISRDGSLILAGGSAAGPVGRIQVAADCQLRTVALKPNKVTTVGIQTIRIGCLALSANGRYALSGSDSIVRLWDVAAAREMRKHVGHTGVVKGVDFHPTAQLVVSVAMDGTARVWDMNGSKMVRMIEGIPALPAGVAFSPDGRSILVWGGGIFGAWDAVTGSPLKGVAAASRRIGPTTLGVCWAPNGQIVVGGAGVTLIDSITGKELQQFIGGPTSVGAVGVSGDGRFVVAGGRNICAWEMDKPLVPEPKPGTPAP